MPIEARAYPRPLPNLEWLGKLTEEILKPDACPGVRRIKHPRGEEVRAF